MKALIVIPNYNHNKSCSKLLSKIHDNDILVIDDGSIKSLARRGYMVLYGQASGPVPPVDPRVLGIGSKVLTRPGLGDYTVTRQELEQRAGDVLGWVKSGELKLRIEHIMALSEASEAHRQLESRLTTGKVVLIP